MSTPTFSILTVTYNAARYLAETLRSVATQAYPHYEHLLWDGGSSDDTVALARSFPHVQVHTGRDEGISDAMNRAAALAQGEWLLYLHGDDFLLHPHVLSLLATFLRQHPPCLWGYGRAALVDDKGSLRATTPYERYSYRRLHRYNFLTHPATFLKKSLFDQLGGFQKKLRYCMDYDLWLRAAEVTSPYALSTPLAAFRHHAGSLSLSLPLAVTDEAYQVRRRYTKGPYARYRSYTTWKRRRRACIKNLAEVSKNY